MINTAYDFEPVTLLLVQIMVQIPQFRNYKPCCKLEAGPEDFGTSLILLTFASGNRSLNLSLYLNA